MSDVKYIDKIIAKGDTLYSLAKQYGTTVEAILAANPKIKDPNVVYAGTIIVIPSTDLPTNDDFRKLEEKYPAPKVDFSTNESSSDAAKKEQLKAEIESKNAENKPDNSSDKEVKQTNANCDLGNATRDNKQKEPPDSVFIHCDHERKLSKVIPFLELVPDNDTFKDKVTVIWTGPNKPSSLEVSNYEDSPVSGGGTYEIPLQYKNNWLKLDGVKDIFNKIWTKNDPPQVYTINGLPSGSCQIKVYNPTKWKLTIKVPNMKSMKMGYKLEGEYSLKGNSSKETEQLNIETATNKINYSRVEEDSSSSLDYNRQVIAQNKELAVAQNKDKTLLYASNSQQYLNESLNYSHSKKEVKETLSVTQKGSFVNDTTNITLKQKSESTSLDTSQTYYSKQEQLLYGQDRSQTGVTKEALAYQKNEELTQINSSYQEDKASAELKSKNSSSLTNNVLPISLERDGRFFDSDLVRLIGQIIELATKIYSIIETLQDSVPKVGYYINFDLQVFQDEFILEWQWKEWTDHRAYFWIKSLIKSTIIKLSCELGVGIEVPAFKAQIFGKISGSFSLELVGEVKSPDEFKIETGPKGIISGAIGVRVDVGYIAEAEGTISSDVTAKGLITLSSKSGLNGTIEIKWTGIKGDLELSIAKGTSVGKTKEYNKTFVEGKVLYNYQLLKSVDINDENLSYEEILRIFESTFKKGWNVRIVEKKNNLLEEAAKKAGDAYQTGVTNVSEKTKETINNLANRAGNSATNSFWKMAVSQIQKGALNTLEFAENLASKTGEVIQKTAEFSGKVIDRTIGTLIEETYDLKEIAMIVTDKVDSRKDLKKDKKSIEALAIQLRNLVDENSKDFGRDCMTFKDFKSLISGNKTNEILNGYINPTLVIKTK